MSRYERELEPLLASPQLPRLVRRLEEILAEEAERRRAFYERITEGEKAEFINGQVIYHSPVRLRHNACSGRLYRLLSTYVAIHDLGYVGYEKLLISLTRNDYEPDICFFGRAKAADFRPDQMHFPAPDFVVEVVSASTEAVDRGIKRVDYALHGVGEYWIVDPDGESLEQYLLDETGEAYRLALKATTGEVQSRVIAGFGIPVRAIFDDAVHRRTLQAILAG